MNHSARRINSIIHHGGHTSYLEIGVKAGKTFFAVEADRRVGVDPRFRFATGDHDRRGTAFFETTSDEYFASLSSSTWFDVIFLDGLHVFEQTYRDFCNSLSHAHATTVWVIDDTIPVDAYSAIPDQARALEERRRTGDTSNAWHGDVYKMIFALHDFHPGFAYRTILGGGNPQTVAWRAPRAGFKPRFDSFEAISRLSFYDLRDNWDLVREGSEANVLEEVARFCHRASAES